MTVSVSMITICSPLVTVRDENSDDFDTDGVFRGP